MMDIRDSVSEWIENSGILSRDCIDELVDFPTKYPSMHCFRQFLSRSFGSGIVLGSILIKLPQLMKIWMANSAKGVSVLAELMMLTATFSALAYGHLKRFPLSAYGDSYSVCLQTFFIIILILRCEYKSKRLISLFVGISILFGSLIFTDLVPPRVILFMNALGVILGSTSKLIQAVVNYRNKSTGQLSSITILLTLAGSLARIFTSIEETGDWTLIATYVVMTFFNFILALQLGYYWHGPNNDTEQENKVKNE